MNTGIQDAANLMWKIALVESQRAHAQLLDSYDRERKPISDALDEVTSVALRAATSSNWLLERFRDALLSRIATLDAVQDRIRAGVSEIGINYRGSSIVRDAAGHSAICAGDRAPDCEAVDETGTRFRIFDLLKEPVHTVFAVKPAEKAELQRLAQILSHYRDIAQGSVLVDGDVDFAKFYAGSGDMLYAVRPDGYIGFRGRCSDLDALEGWMSELFIKREDRS